MKRNFVIKGVMVILFCAFGMGVNAQNTFSKGDNVAGVAIGLGGYYSGAFYKDVKRIPFVSAYYETCIKDNLFDAKSSLGIGGMLGYTSVNVADYYRASTTVIGVRGALHYAFIDKLDTYAGVMLGYNIVGWKWLDSYWSDTKGNASSSLALGGFLGARYYFTDVFAAFAEVGYGAANINIGIAMKF